MMNVLQLLFSALVLFASSRTKRYFLSDPMGKQDIANLIETVRALLNADYAEPIIAHNGSMHDQTDYKMIGNVPSLWMASLLYTSATDVVRRTNRVYQADLPALVGDFNPNGFQTLSPSDEKETPKDDQKEPSKDGEGLSNSVPKRHNIVGEVLTPDEFELVVNKYNENQKDGGLLALQSLSGYKGAEIFSLKGFADADSNFVLAGNVNGTIDKEVALCLGVQCLYNTAKIDEISEKEIEKWLLSQKSTT